MRRHPYQLGRGRRHERNRAGRPDGVFSGSMSSWGRWLEAQSPQRTVGGAPEAGLPGSDPAPGRCAGASVGAQRRRAR
eukprot:scaffold13094_cov70-Phaeocystis_antarctica.AAC.11